VKDGRVRRAVNCRSSRLPRFGTDPHEGRRALRCCTAVAAAAAPAPQSAAGDCRGSTGAAEIRGWRARRRHLVGGSAGAVNRLIRLVLFGSLISEAEFYIWFLDLHKGKSRKERCGRN